MRQVDNLIWEPIKEEPLPGTGGGDTAHNKLTGLDYANSGHIGFASSDDIPTKLSELENDLLMAIRDTRSENKTPLEYMQLDRHEQNEFKLRATIDNPPVGTGNSGVFVLVKTIVPWRDISGGYPVQIAYGTNGIAFRGGTSDTTWSAWTRVDAPDWSVIKNKPSSMPANGGNASTVGGIAAADLTATYRQEFYVGGNADMYYPVVFRGVTNSNFFGGQLLYVYRGYEWAAPDTWNTAIHRGGLDIKIETFLAGWGGRQYYMDILLGQTYSNVVANIEVANPDTSTIIIWLRGGNALYAVQTTSPNVSVSVHLGTYAHMPGTQYETLYPARLNVESVFERSSYRRRIAAGYDQFHTMNYNLPRTATKVY